MTWVRQAKVQGKSSGGYSSKVYAAWIRMRRRCHNPKDKDFRYYGQRGIWVCDEWRNSYESFREWAIANGVARDLTLERINNDMGYFPANCRWAPQSEQSQNRTMSKLTEDDVRHIRTVGMSPAEIRRRYGVSKHYSYKLSGNHVWKHIQPECPGKEKGK